MNSEKLDRLEGKLAYDNLFTLSKENDKVIEGFTQSLTSLELNNMKAHFYEQRLNELRVNDFVDKAIPLFDLIRNLKTNQFDHYRSYKTSAETFDSEYFHKKERS